MTVLLITALRAAETLAAYHRQRVNQTLGAPQAYHQDMAGRCLADIEYFKRQFAAAGATFENQATEMRRRDLETAHRIVERHPIMQGIGMRLDDVAQARVAMARDIADALAAERGGLPAA